MLPSQKAYINKRWAQTQEHLNEEIAKAKEMGLIEGAYVVQVKHNTHKLRQIERIETDYTKVHGLEHPNFIILKVQGYKDVGWHYSELSIVHVDGSESLSD